jgi:hypothetical protein
MARVRGAPYHPNDKGKISVPVRRRVEKKIASVRVGYRTGVLILTGEPDRLLLFPPRRTGAIRLNHPRRDLVRSIGVCPASTPWSRAGALS